MKSDKVGSDRKSEWVVYIAIVCFLAKVNSGVSEDEGNKSNEVSGKESKK